jgi:hypothetical protein
VCTDPLPSTSQSFSFLKQHDISSKCSSECEWHCGFQEWRFYPRAFKLLVEFRFVTPWCAKAPLVVLPPTPLGQLLSLPSSLLVSF